MSRCCGAGFEFKLMPFEFKLMLAKPLTEMLKKGNFEKAMTTTPILALPDFSQPFIIEADASNSGDTTNWVLILPLILTKSAPSSFWIIK